MAEERRAYGFIVAKTKGKIQLGRPKRGWDANLKTDLKETVKDVVVLVRIGTNDWLLWTRSRTLWLHTILGISSQAEELLASQEVLSSIELVREVLNDGHIYCFQLTNSAIRLLYLH